MVLVKYDVFPFGWGFFYLGFFKKMKLFFGVFSSIPPRDIGVPLGRTHGNREKKGFISWDPED